MCRITTEFDLDMPDGKFITVDASGDLLQEGGQAWLEDVTIEVWIFKNSAALEGRKLSDDEIQDFKRWCDLDEIVDHKLYSRWEQLKEEGPEWERDAG